MPPKRKRADATQDSVPSTSVRATRSSTRAVKVASDAKMGSTSGEVDGPPPPSKKSKTKAATVPKSTPAKVTKPKKKTTQPREDPIHDEPDVETAKQVVSQKPASTAETTNGLTEPPKGSLKLPKTEPFTPQRSLSLFKVYADQDTGLIGPEGFEQLCTDSNIPLDGAVPLLLAWQLGAKEMAQIKEDEWVTGMTTLRISTLSQLALALNDLNKLLVLDEAVTNRPAKKGQEPYEMTNYWGYADNKKAAFRKFYMFCFQLVKPEASRNIDMETTTAFWSVLLAPQFPIMSEIIAFVTENPTKYKATNKDLWSMMLEFCETVKPNLQDYESEGAWPTLLDDFVAFKKQDSGPPSNSQGDLVED